MGPGSSLLLHPEGTEEWFLGKNKWLSLSISNQEVQRFPNYLWHCANLAPSSHRRVINYALWGKPEGGILRVLLYPDLQVAPDRGLEGWSWVKNAALSGAVYFRSRVLDTYRIIIYHLQANAIWGILKRKEEEAKEKKEQRSSNEKPHTKTTGKDVLTQREQNTLA